MPQTDKSPAQVRSMFARVARAYDWNNRLHTLGRDMAWRRAAVRAAGELRGQPALDAACGTGDLTGLLAVAGATPVVGLDFCPEMLEIARRKFSRAPSQPIEWIAGDATALPFADATFQAVTIAFGLRNIPEPDKALADFFRVLRPGGRLVVLEFVSDGDGLLAKFMRFYTGRIMPWTAGLFARGQRQAYRYLHTSIVEYLSSQQQAERIAKAGFEVISSRMFRPLPVGLWAGVKET